jgi:RNA polymerase sigma-70 factor (ECF subfamily)
MSGGTRFEAPATYGRVEAVYREQGDAMWRAVFAYSADPEIASDAVAEAFAQALRRADAIDDPAAWIWRVAFRLAAGSLKEGGAHRSAVDEGSYEIGQPVVDLVAALGRLSTKQRGCVVLHHYAGHPVKDVALMLGSTPAAVRVHLTRGRRRLRDLLGADYGTA